MKQVSTLLPKHFSVQSRAALVEESVKSMSSGETSITTIFLLSFGILAMLVAALVIANTFQVLVAQRRRTLALLRTIGANKSQLYVSVLFEAGVLGLIASALGVGLGIGLMAALCQSGLMKATGMTMRLVLSGPVFTVPMAFGIIMTVIASLGSARSATAVTPLEALRPVELTDTRRAGVVRAVISVLLIVAGVALCAFSVWQMSENIAGRDSMADKQYPLVLLGRHHRMCIDRSLAGCFPPRSGYRCSCAAWARWLHWPVRPPKWHMRTFREPAPRGRHRCRTAYRRDAGLHHRHRCRQRQANHERGADHALQRRHDCRWHRYDW
mgnify:CR=1 FL=1